MAAGYPEWMRDATGQVHRYVQAPQAARPTPPEYPHPGAVLEVNWSGNPIRPWDTEPIAVWSARYTDATGQQPGDGDGRPVSGDETARAAREQCWDPTLSPGTCTHEACPHPRPHRRGWLWQPRYGDIAHVLYPGGVLPVPAEPEPEPVPEPKPVQLDLLAYLETAS